MRSRIISALFVPAALLSACSSQSKTSANSTSASTGEVTRGSPPAWLTARIAQEASLARTSPAFHDFSLANRTAASGITFVHRIVDDAGKNYKAVHYDHGTGLAAADVDGDGLIDLYFVTQLGTNELWKNVGGGKFTNITASSGLSMPDAIAVGASFADIDNDGDPDLFVTTVRHGNRLFENLGNGKFRDITAQAGVGFSGHSSGAVFFDYDGDGLLDLFVTNVGVYTSDVKAPDGHYVGLADAFHGHMHPERADTSILYHNLGGNKFEDVTKKTGLIDPSWSGDAVVMDVNGDGFPDVYALSMQGANHLWLNQGGKTFRDATSTYFPKTPWGAMGAKVFDFNGDGSLDLYVTDMHSDMFDNIAPGDWAAEARKADTSKMPGEVVPKTAKNLIFGNALFIRAEKSAAFSDVSDKAGVETYWPWGPSVDDINADGWDDIFVANSMNFPFRYEPNSLLLNEGGKHFLPAAFTLGIEPRAEGWTKWFTVDCNGADADNPACGMCNGPTGANMGCQATAPGKFTVMGANGTRSAVFVDIDNDGDLDLVTNEFNAPPMILMSNLSTKRPTHFLKIRLHGTASNREGLGARVTVTLPGGRKILKVMDGKSGYLSQSDLPLYFGLGDAPAATSIEVVWPSGKRQVVGPIESGTTQEIIEK